MAILTLDFEVSIPNIPYRLLEQVSSAVDPSGLDSNLTRDGKGKLDFMIKSI